MQSEQGKLLLRWWLLQCACARECGVFCADGRPAHACRAPRDQMSRRLVRRPLPAVQGFLRSSFVSCGLHAKASIGATQGDSGRLRALVLGGRGHAGCRVHPYRKGVA